MNDIWYRWEKTKQLTRSDMYVPKPTKMDPGSADKQLDANVINYFK